jgi:hypothetical protein
MDSNPNSPTNLPKLKREGISLRISIDHFKAIEDIKKEFIGRENKGK